MERFAVLLLVSLLATRASESAAGFKLGDEVVSKTSDAGDGSVISDGASTVSDQSLAKDPKSDDISDTSDNNKRVTLSDDAYISNLDGDIKNRSVRKLNDESNINRLIVRKDAETQTDSLSDTDNASDSKINSSDSRNQPRNAEVFDEMTRENIDKINKNYNGSIVKPISEIETKLSNTGKDFERLVIKPSEIETNNTNEDINNDLKSNKAIPIALDEFANKGLKNNTKRITAPEDFTHSTRKANISKDVGISEGITVPVPREEPTSRCPSRCDCVIAPLELRCSEVAPPREPSSLVVSGERHYVNIECHEYRNVTCSEIPRYNLCDGGDVISIGLKRCRAVGVLPCIRGALNIGAVNTLTYKELPTHTVLHREDFDGAPALDRIIVISSSSDNVSISADAVAELPTLRRLFLSAVSVPTAPILRLPRTLTALELTAARLTSLPASLLSPLTGLERLILNNNMLQHIEDGVFDGLKSLQSIDLTTNRFRSVPAAILRVQSLTQLVINNNPLQRVHPLTPLTNLVNLTIIMNLSELELLPNALADMPHLTKVDIKYSRVRSLPPNTFRGSRALVKLDMSYNAISELPTELLSDQTALQRLDLSHNKLRAIPPRLFAALTQLKVLKLDYNQLIELPVSMLSGARSLTHLSVSHNSLLSVKRAALIGATEMEDIDLSYNNLTYYDPDSADVSMYFQLDVISPFNGLMKLRKIRLSHNNIKSSFHDVATSMVQLDTYDLSYNKITEIGAMNELYFISNNVTVDMTHNDIHTVMLNTVPLLSGPDPRNSRILLDHNPLHCDCRLYELARRLEGLRPNPDFSPSEPKFDIGNAQCDSPDNLKGRLFRTLNDNELACDIEAEICPENCQCKWRPATNSSELTCTEPPSTFPIPNTIPGIIKVKLTEPPKALDKLSPTVVELDLSELRLKSIPSGIPDVKLLNLSYNSLLRAPVELLERNITLLLTGNNFSCDCSHAHDLHMMEKHSNKIQDYRTLVCSSGELVISRSAARLCDIERAALLGGLLALFGVIVAITALLIYRHSLVVKVFLFKYGICIFDEDDLDEEKTYDAFLSFSHDDERLVIDEILPGLEGGPVPFRICVHYRDWIAGEWIPAQIARSVEQSRRTIVVLSRNFLDSIWGRLEFRTAHMSAVKESRSRVIVILLEDVSGHKELDAELRAYLATNTYLKWGEPQFWDKLRFALPRHRGEKRARLLGRKLVQDAIEAGKGGKTGGGIEAAVTKEGKIVNIAAIKAAPA